MTRYSGGMVMRRKPDGETNVELSAPWPEHARGGQGYPANTIEGPVRRLPLTAKQSADFRDILEDVKTAVGRPVEKKRRDKSQPVEAGGPLDPTRIDAFVQVRSRVHETYIRETERTRRLALGLSAVLLALACLVPVFAPTGRETLSYALGGALFVFAAGGAGFSAVKLTHKDLSVSASTDRNDQAPQTSPRP